MNDSRFDALVAQMRGTYDNSDPGHDWAHIERVMTMCRHLCAESGADPAIALPAALLHDVINVPKNHPDRMDASRQAAVAARAILARHDYRSEEIDRIAVAIVEHSFSRGLKASTPESAVLQDSDRLDAIGAIGVMRTVTCGAKMGSRYYSPEEPIAVTRALDDKAFTIDHLFVKLFKLAEMMNTDAAKREAAKRTEFMRAFVAQLKSEISG